MYNERGFSQQIQRKINWFAFFLAFPFLSVLGNSITFYIFILIIGHVGFFWNKYFKGKYVFFGFLFIGVLSGVLSPVLAEQTDLRFISILIQYTYWVIMASFFIIFRARINFLQTSKWLFYGTFLYILTYYFLYFNIDNPIVSLEFKPGRNSFVFNLICCVPLSFIYITQRWRGARLYFFILFFIGAMLMTNGRSGSIIILIQTMLVLSIIQPNFRRIGKIFVCLFLILFAFFQNSNSQIYIDAIAQKVETINPRFAALLKNEGDGDLEQDKSWLIRKLMIDKGIEIVKKYPFIGIGPNNFAKYQAELETFSNYNRLQEVSFQKLSTRTSAHNSYLQVAAEFGIIGFIIFLFLYLPPLLLFARLFIKGNLNLNHLALVSLIGMMIHFYAIAAFLGALPWFILGICWSYLQKSKT
ncbi:O-antigen ligase family protein [Sphingobacterium siyangense]|uniref:O-antigen ligase family protein n=1 Tax=Sphingobacterium siyangense TaxID=459529 RepID=UPI002FDD8FA5